MGLLGWPLLLLSVLLAVATPVATVLFYRWGRRSRWIDVPVRLVMVMLSQVAAVAMVGVAVNDHFQFYASWNDLFGSVRLGGSLQQAGSGSAGPLVDARSPGPLVRFSFNRNDDTYVTVLKGPQSKVRDRIHVWLPPQYHNPAYARARFPVIELFSGYPGTPVTWFHAMQCIQQLKREMAAGKARPFILVAPVINVWSGHDTECTNIRRGPQVATWLTQDVRNAVLGNFRALPGGEGWGLMGYSTGGFCAAKLAVQYPNLYGAAVSMSGYFSPTSPLITRDPQLRQENSPLALIRHSPYPHVALLLAGSRQDPGVVSQVQAMVSAVRPPTRVFTYIVAVGGHNTRVWSAMLPAAYDWLTRQLRGPA